MIRHSDWGAQMNQTISSPIPGFSGQVIRASEVSPVPTLDQVRMFLVGRLRTGKTSVAANNPKAFGIDAEGKMHLLDPAVRLCDFTRPRNLKEIDEAFDGLCNEKHKYTHVIVDTLDEILYSYVIPGMTAELKLKHPSCNDVREFGQGGKGWDMIGFRIAGWFRKLSMAGLGYTVIGHLKGVEEKSTGPGGVVMSHEVWRVAVPRTVRAMISRLSWVSAAIRVRSGSAATKRVLIDGKWMASTPEIEARPDFGALVKDTLERQTQERYLKAEVTSGETLDLGANLRFPSEVILTSPGIAWADLEAAYNAMQSPSARTDSVPKGSTVPTSSQETTHA